MRISDWSSDVCSSDLVAMAALADPVILHSPRTGLYVGSTSSRIAEHERVYAAALANTDAFPIRDPDQSRTAQDLHAPFAMQGPHYTLSTACPSAARSEAHTSVIQSLMRISEAVI